MQKPKKFKGGHGSSVMEFMLKCNMYMDVNMRGKADIEKPLFIISFLEAEALVWMKPMLELHYSGIPQPRINNLQIFCRDFQEAFGKVDRKETYRRKYRAVTNPNHSPSIFQ